MKKLKTVFIRGNFTESTHEIKVLIKNNKNKTLLTTGNENDFIFPRSSVKIFQAIPFVSSNAIKKFNLSKKMIALSCASHRGEDFHLKELENWLGKVNINKSVLKCGSHNPLNPFASEKLMRSNKKINQLHNNCAGKHLAMISSCRANNHDIKNYLKFSHPHQIEIRKIFEMFSENKIKKKYFAVDGCSAPQYSFRICDINKLLNNLIKSYKNEFTKSYETKILINSIISNPKYIGGSDSLDSDLMKISNKNLFCKGGAEGVFLFIDLKKEISGVIKVSDGNERAIPSLIFNIFKKFKVMNNKELYEFKKKYNFNLLNHAKIKIGSVKSTI